MATKVQEVEQKKGSKAQNREGEKGQWWPSEVTDSELKSFAKEGLIAPDTWSFQKDSSSPKPEPDEVFTKAWVERGLSLPPSKFFLSVLNTYGLQPHNICPNSYLLLSNFVTLCEGHLGIRPDVCLWQFFYRVKKETKDKVMVNCGSMTFMLRPQTMFPTLASHESVWYWNARWFYVKNVPVPGIHDGLPKFVNNPPEELLLKYNKRLICEYSRVEDQLRVTWDNLPTDSLNKRIRTLVKLTRGQEVPEIYKDISVNNKCPPVFGPDAGASGEASAKKPKTKPHPCLDSKKAERDRISTERITPAAPRRHVSLRKYILLIVKFHYLYVSFACCRSQKVPASRVNTQKPIKNYMRTSPAVAPTTPAPPSTSNPAPHPTPPEAQPSPDPAANAQVEVIPVSSEKGGGSCSATKRAAPEGPQDKNLEEAEVTSTDEAKASAKDAVRFLTNFGDPSNLFSTPKAYSHKFFSKLTKMEKWELEQDLQNSKLNNSWGASCSLATASSELENLRFAYQDLESKLKEAEEKRELAEKKLTEKNFEFIREKADSVAKWKVDSETLKNLQSELQGLQNYTTTAEKGWDLLNSEVMEPLGYDEARRDMFPRDDLIKLAGDDCRDLISACRKICHNLAIKDSRTCDVK
ncbi:hypothetical protein QYE76_011036 [Lolium multiflorum]|uniref:Transposase (putative) gypsy type domain-containing protein n=1 Tax=Lolium multiflorum TaxID=4521 RepID=A0AAD8X587_LOLMU|nr:hypothetical protein QYE76_011036 [Lolium multiflorum]